jgi:3-carboxy-cis,cis-muconate cycloisomerase
VGSAHAFVDAVLALHTARKARANQHQE